MKRRSLSDRIMVATMTFSPDRNLIEHITSEAVYQQFEEWLTRITEIYDLQAIIRMAVRDE